MSRKEHIIRSYINAYNQFDIPGMVANLHDNIVFKNIQDGETNLLYREKKSSDSRQSSLKPTLKKDNKTLHL